MFILHFTSVDKYLIKKNMVSPEVLYKGLHPTYQGPPGDSLQGHLVTLYMLCYDSEGVQSL